MVSLTTFPARITTVWATIATLLRQDVPPDAVLLVVADEEFPDRKLPRSLRRLQRRGLIVHWVTDNLKSFNKLLPARRAHPDATIVTVDDDVLYEPDLLRTLSEASDERPGWIVGNRGWDPIRDAISGGYRPYREWMQAGRAGPDSDPDEVFLTGVGGILYPPGCVDDELLLDAKLAMSLAPTADDVWFWAVEQASGSRRFCTGCPYGRPNGLEGLGPSLFVHNKSANDAQIAATVARLARLRSEQAESEESNPSPKGR